MKKRHLGMVLFALTLMMGLCVLPAAADKPHQESITCWPAYGCIMDEAEMLADPDEETLAAAIYNATSDTEGGYFYMATYRAKNRYDDYTGNEFCRDHGIGTSDTKATILLIVTYDEWDGQYYYDMYTYGDAYQRISQKEVDYILDYGEVYNNLKSGRIAEGVETFVGLSAKAYNGRVGVSMWIIILVCALISAVIATCVCVGVVSSYKVKNKPVDYPLHHFAKLDLTHEDDVEVDRRVIALPLPKSGGSRGGGRSSHGGGGGHRGGR